MFFSLFVQGRFNFFNQFCHVSRFSTRHRVQEATFASNRYKYKRMKPLSAANTCVRSPCSGTFYFASIKTCATKCKGEATFVSRDSSNNLKRPLDLKEILQFDEKKSHFCPPLAYINITIYCTLTNSSKT